MLVAVVVVVRCGMLVEVVVVVGYVIVEAVVVDAVVEALKKQHDGVCSKKNKKEKKNDLPAKKNFLLV